MGREIPGRETEAESLARLRRESREDKMQNPFTQQGPTEERTKHSTEVVSGVTVDFSPTGLDADAKNIYNTSVSMALDGRFHMLQPLRTYEEYLDDQSKKYEKLGIKGYAEAIMVKGKMVAEETGAGFGVPTFNAIVDEYNAELDRIKREEDLATVEAFVKRFREVETKLPEEKTTNADAPDADNH